MNFDSIFPVIVVLIYIASLFLSAKKKRKQAEDQAKAKAETKAKAEGKTKGEKPEGKLPGWRQALDGVASRIQQEFKPAGGKPGREEDLWEMLLRKTPAREHDQEPIRDMAEDNPVEPPPAPRPAHPDIQPEIVEPLPGNTPGRATISDLRNAVVWSEILGPPVALRK